MQCPKCGFVQPDNYTDCGRCGIIFEKYRRLQDQKSPSESSASTQVEPSLPPGEIIQELLFYVKPETNPVIFAGRALLFLVIFVWGMKFILTPLGSNYVFSSFWHLVNLPFHEFGHIVFRPFGRLLTSLGGSITQVLMPLLCLAVFLMQTRDTFGASFALWWTGESFMDLAPYINDARSLTMPLLGGNTGRTSPYGFHDWEFILKETGLLRYDHALASLSYMTGAIMMICALAWSGYILLKQYKNINRRLGMME